MNKNYSTKLISTDAAAPQGAPPALDARAARSAANGMFVDDWYLVVQVALYAYVLYRALTVSAAPLVARYSELFNGGMVRSWFLSIQSFGLGLRIFCLLVILVLPHRTPFLLSWFHYIPGLVLLSSYSILIIFFSEIRRKSEGAVIPTPCSSPGHGGSRSGRSWWSRWSLGYMTLGYIAPSLIGCNLLVYILFAIVGSLAHIKHAHREFRIAGALFIGVTHALLAVAWLYNTGILSVHIIKRSQRSQDLIALDDPFIRRDAGLIEFESNKHTRVLAADYGDGPFGGQDLGRFRSVGRPSYYIDSFKYMNEDLQIVKFRLCLLAFFCPLLFLLGGVLEVQKGLEWAENPLAANLNFFTEFSVMNMLIYLAEICPAFICISTFSAKKGPDRRGFLTEESYVLTN